MRVDRESLLQGLPPDVVNLFRANKLTTSVYPGEMFDIGRHHLMHQNPIQAAGCMEWVLKNDATPPDVLNWTAAAILEAAQEITNTPAQNIAPLAIKVLRKQSTYADDRKISAAAQFLLEKYSPHTL